MKNLINHLFLNNIVASFKGDPQRRSITNQQDFLFILPLDYNSEQQLLEREGFRCEIG